MQPRLLLHCLVWESMLQFLYVTHRVQTAVPLSAVNCTIGVCRSKMNDRNKDCSFPTNNQAAWSSVTKVKSITDILTNK